MPVILIVTASIAAFLAGYRLWGSRVAREAGLDDSRATPAETVNDGQDFVPTEPGYLLGQHFSAIAAAGPIVGPIAACLAFGWLPAILWIVVGSIFIGAVHDFSALAGSVRHGALSIASIVERHMGRSSYLAFLAFLWLSLIYVIIAFTDVTAGSFLADVTGGAVATSSLLYLVLGLAMGLCLKAGMPLRPATFVFVLLVGLAIWWSPRIPLTLDVAQPRKLWSLLILAYCILASLAPVWLLMQPRGHLGGYFLYTILAGAILGLLWGGGEFTTTWPAFTSWESAQGPLFPVLFVTIACGACSGFHGLVCSGTTSKQIKKESHCRSVGYGAMLLEGLVAVIALATVMVLPAGTSAGGPDAIYARGIAGFIAALGINADFALTFASLAFATFVYDTLDVAMRLGRHILMELLGKDMAWRILATLLTAGLPAGYFLLAPESMMVGGKPVATWKLVWTLFGSSNQLLGGLTLLTMALWLKRDGRPHRLVLLPGLFMLGITVCSLLRFLSPLVEWPATGGINNATVNALVALLFLGLAGFLGYKGWCVLRQRSVA
ncbi:MAG: carbon starvation protein A [Planctomycetota bacterium]